MRPRVVKAFLDAPIGEVPNLENSRLYFCRGPRCVQPDIASRTVRCPDCLLPRDDESMEQVSQRILRGDA